MWSGEPVDGGSVAGLLGPLTRVGSPTLSPPVEGTSSVGTVVGTLSSPPTCGSGDAGGGPEETEEDGGPFEADALPGAGGGSTDASFTGPLTRAVSPSSAGASAGGGKGGGKTVPSDCGFLSGLRAQSSL